MVAHIFNAVRQSRLLRVGDEVVAWQGYELLNEVASIDHLNVLLKEYLLMRVHVDHCRVE